MRRVVGGLLVAAALTMAAGQTRAQVQLTFRYAQDNPEQVQAGIVEFERRNPEIKVAFEQSSGVNANTEHPAEAWKLMQWLNSWDFWKQYNTTYYPAQKSLLAKRPFPPEMTGFQKQFADGARSWGPYARGPAPIAGMWNQVARSFGQAFIGDRTSMQAAEDILAYVQGQLKQ